MRHTGLRRLPARSAYCRYTGQTVSLHALPLHAGVRPWRSQYALRPASRFSTTREKIPRSRGLDNEAQHRGPRDDGVAEARRGGVRVDLLEYPGTREPRQEPGAIDHLHGCPVWRHHLDEFDLHVHAQPGADVDPGANRWVARRTGNHGDVLRKRIPVIADCIVLRHAIDDIRGRDDICVAFHECHGVHRRQAACRRGGFGGATIAWPPVAGQEAPPRPPRHLAFECPCAAVPSDAMLLAITFA